MGAVAILRCRGSTPTKLRPLELNPQVKHHSVMWLARSFSPRGRGSRSCAFERSKMLYVQRRWQSVRIGNADPAVPQPVERNHVIAYRERNSIPPKVHSG